MVLPKFFSKFNNKHFFKGLHGISLSDQLQESLSSKIQRLEIENEQLRAADRHHSGVDGQILACRHCLEKDSAIGTIHTSEDACS